MQRTKQRQNRLDDPYRNRQDKVHSPVRVLSAHIPNRSSNTETNVSLRHEFSEPFWEQYTLNVEKNQSTRRNNLLAALNINSFKSDSMKSKTGCPYHHLHKSERKMFSFIFLPYMLLLLQYIIHRNRT